MTALPHHDAEDDLLCVAQLLEITCDKGLKWLHSLHDWRARRYKRTAGRLGRNSPQPLTQKDGKPPIEILMGSEKPIIKNTVTKGMGTKPCNIIVCPDPSGIKHGKGWVALLRVVPHDNFDKIRNVNFYIWFHSISNANPDKDQLMGWRFEGSEGSATSHNLYHAQPIKGFHNGVASDGCIDWIPETFPTIPIAAKNQVQLALAALLTLGGKEALRKILQDAKHPSLRTQAREYWGSIFAGESLEVEIKKP
ncbi:MAG TPA: hypothetical protein VFF75_05175 [Methylophilaceae bacterium]|nr:hypothetical protein [Methylophilaceae bacterium]